MKKIILTALLAVIASTGIAQTFVGDSDYFTLPLKGNNGYDIMTKAFFRHYMTDNERYTTMTIATPDEDNTQFNEGDKVIIQYSNNSTDTCSIVTTQKAFAEFEINHNNIIKKSIEQIQLAEYTVRVKKNQRTGLLNETFRREIANASANAQKKKANNITADENSVKKVHATRRETERFGIGFSSGIISLSTEGINNVLAYGAYLSLFNVYADFRMMPTIKQQLTEDTTLKTSIYQANIGYRINILEGFGITPLVGITKVNSKAHATAESYTLVDKLYINYGLMFDHIYRHHTGIGIKTGITVQRHNFGMTFGVSYNW